MKELACRDEQLSLNDLIELTIRLDRLCQTNRTVLCEPNVPVQGAATLPMQLGRAQLRDEERD